MLSKHPRNQQLVPFFLSLAHPLSQTSCFYSTTPPSPSCPHNPASFMVKKCISLLQICGSSELKLRQIHAFSLRHGIPLKDPDICKHLIYNLVSLSTPCHVLTTSFLLFRAPIYSLIWNTMIRGYAESETPKPALELYRKMQASCIEPDTHTYPFLLKAVAKLADVRVGENAHSTVIRNGFDLLVCVQNSLLHMYATCGLVDSACKVFELMPKRDVVAWNSMINGFALNKKPNEALTLDTSLD